MNVEASFVCHYCGHRFRKWIYGFGSSDKVICPNGDCNTTMKEQNVIPPAKDSKDRDVFGYEKTERRR